ncbi:GNAT family N-acetyltransferase [Methylococcus mesophilus]|nr:GNAT family N-acetyltransferase [Methylococcus mesophilus]UZR30313.1 GNAT family N-acetyltransferase [Methylococcus mesophilus]
MKLEWKESLDGVDWNELAALYRAAPLGEKSPSDLEKVFSNSLYRLFVYDDGRIVGVGRALADGADCSYICDVAVLPSHQGAGIGRGIVGKLIALSAGHKKIILYSAPGKEPFYRSLGFKRMTTAMAIFENQSQALGWGLVNETYIHQAERWANALRSLL